MRACAWVTIVVLFVIAASVCATSRAAVSLLSRRVPRDCTHARMRSWWGIRNAARRVNCGTVDKFADEVVFTISVIPAGVLVTTGEVGLGAHARTKPLRVSATVDIARELNVACRYWENVFARALGVRVRICNLGKERRKQPEHYSHSGRDKTTRRVMARHRMGDLRICAWNFASDASGVVHPTKTLMYCHTYGPSVPGGYGRVHYSKVTRNMHGNIAINTRSASRLTTSPRKISKLANVHYALCHEMGHAFGLHHNCDRNMACVEHEKHPKSTLMLPTTRDKWAIYEPRGGVRLRADRAWRWRWPHAWRVDSTGEAVGARVEFDFMPPSSFMVKHLRGLYIPAACPEDSEGSHDDAEEDAEDTDDDDNGDERAGDAGDADGDGGERRAKRARPPRVVLTDYLRHDDTEVDETEHHIHAFTLDRDGHSCADAATGATRRLD